MEASREILHPVSAVESVTMATPREAQDFSQGAMQELNKIIVGEEDAKFALLTTMVMGGNFLGIGGTGVGKTKIARNVWRLLEDVRPEEVAHLDVRDDMQPQELTGMVVPTGNQIDGKQEMIVVEGLIKPNTKIVVGNEFNRAAPSVTNTFLEIAENREMERNGRIISLDNLWMVIANMNPGERRQKVHDLSVADAVRFEAGGLMGEDPDSNKRRREAMHLHGWKPQQPEAVISIDGLKEIRRFAQEGVAYSHDAGQYGIRVVTALEEQLAARKISEKGGRMDDHLISLSKTIAALRGETKATPEHVVKAAQYMATAVIGGLVRQPASEVVSAHKALEAVKQR